MEITKLVLCGFWSADRELTLNFDGDTRFSDDTDVHFSQSVTLAFNFILNPMLFESPDVAKRCLHKHSHWSNNKRSYVRMYIISEGLKNFWKGKKKESVPICRYVNESNFRHMFVGENEVEFTLPDFQQLLNDLQHGLVLEPFISERSFPSDIDLNRMFIKSMGLDKINSTHDSFLKNDDEIEKGEELHATSVRSTKSQLVQERTVLTNVQTRDAAILIKQRPNPAEVPELVANASAAFEKQREIKILLSAHKNETIQRIRFDHYTHMLNVANDVQITCHNLDFNAMDQSWKQYYDEVKMYMLHKQKAREFKEKAEKLQVIARTNLHMDAYIDDPNRSTERSIEFFEKEIQAIEKRIREYQQDRVFHSNKRKCLEMPDKMNGYYMQLKQDVLHLSRLQTEQVEIQLDSLRTIRDMLVRTNQMTLSEVHIDAFFETQTILNPTWILAWKKGVLALTLMSNKSADIGFVGNVLDFINPNVQLNAHWLPIVVPLLCQEYFGMFMFKTESAGNIFAHKVKPFVLDGLKVSFYVTKKVDQKHLKNLPYTSLADVLLTKDIRARFPMVEQWFDQIRICTIEENPKKLKRLAVKFHCKIFYKNECFFEDGTHSIVVSELDVNDLRTFIVEWQKVSGHRDLILKTHHQNSNTKMIDTNKHSSLIVDTHKNIREQCTRLSYDAKQLIILFDKQEDVELFITTQRARLDVLKEFVAKLKVWLRNPAIRPTFETDTSQPGDCPKHDIITQTKIIMNFLKHVSHIQECSVKDFHFIDQDLVDQFKQDVGRLQQDSAELLTFNYKEQFKTMAFESEDHLKQLCTETGKQIVNHCMAIHQQAAITNKIGMLNTDDLCDMEQAERLSQLSIDQLKNASFRDREEAALPAPQGIEEFENQCTDIDNMIPELEEDISQPPLLQLYFDEMVENLKILNDLNIFNGGTIGFEMRMAQNITIHVFPHSHFADWHRLSILQVCNAGISFVVERNGEISENDLVCVQRHRFALFFYLAMSLRANPSLILLNHSIIGLPVDERQAFTDTLKSDILHRLEEKPQIISVSQNPNA